MRLARTFVLQLPQHSHHSSPQLTTSSARPDLSCLKLSDALVWPNISPHLQYPSTIFTRLAHLPFPPHHPHCSHAQPHPLDQLVYAPFSALLGSHLKHSFLRLFLPSGHTTQSHHGRTPHPRQLIPGARGSAQHRTVGGVFAESHVYQANKPLSVCRC